MREESPQGSRSYNGFFVYFHGNSKKAAPHLTNLLYTHYYPVWDVFANNKIQKYLSLP